MNNQTHNQIVSFIWGIADDCLRDVYVRGKYRDVFARLQSRKHL
jgi:type I restriction enzyme M protein